MSQQEREHSGAAKVVRARRPLLALLGALTVLALTQLPRLESRFAPEELVAPDESARADAERARTEFGAEGEAIVLLVEGEDVLASEPLAWIHRAARALEAAPEIERVLGPTTVPMARRRAAEVEDEGDLDTLDLDTLELDTLDLDTLGGADVGAPDALDPRLTALSEVAMAHPGRFPLGLTSLLNEGAEVRVQPLVAGETPTEAERLAITEELGRSPLFRRRLVSDDRRVAAIAALLRPGTNEAGIASALAVARQVADAPGGGLRVRLTGLPAIRAEMIEALHRDQILLVTVAALLSLLVLIVGMRSVAGVALPFGTVGMTVAMTVGAMAWAGEPINLLTNMIPPLLLTIGMAEAVHMVLRWEEEVAGGLSRLDAAIETLRHMWLPCFVTTFTTAIGFGALILQETAILRRFGLIAGLASMLAYVVTVTFVPAMLPSSTPRRARATSGEDDLLERLMVGIAKVTSTEWRWVLIGSALLFLAGASVARDIEVDSRLMDQFARGSEVAETTRLLETSLDGVRALDVVLEAGPGHFLEPGGIDDLDALTEHLRAQPGVLRVTSEADWLRELRGALVPDAPREASFATAGEVRALRDLAESEPSAPLERFVTPDGARARLEVRLADRGASRILAMLDVTREVAEARGLHIRFSGEAYDASRGLDRIVRSLGSLGAAVAMIFLVMTLLFRSLRLGLLSIPPNALPLVLTLAYMVLRGIPLHAATVIVFTVTVGLSVDGATHVIARFQEEAKSGLSAREIVLRTVRSSGRGVVLSAATLLFGYLALLFSAFEPVRLFGELSLVAIFGALVAQIVLLPALLAVFAMPRGAASSAADAPTP